MIQSRTIGREEPADPHLAGLMAGHDQDMARFHEAHQRFREQVIPRVAQLRAAVDHDPVLYPVRGILHGRLDAAQQQLEAIDRRLTDVGMILPSPSSMRAVAQLWIRIRADLGGIVGDLSATNREVQFSWQGQAAEVYDKVVLPTQVAAVRQLAVVADTFQRVLSWAALVGTVFTAAIVGLVVGLIAGAWMAIGAALPLAFGAAAAVGGSVLLLALASSFFSQLQSLIVQASEAFSRMRIWMDDLMSQIGDTSVFPGGKWPDALTQHYADATVNDRDAKWSVAPA
jgi:hypothetical protein